ncbi:MAG: class I SAM-dependent methyltransferase [Chlorobiales bacterium]|nr:class I SAM-dependent methyltransferase [Chlorobiales bacterium]
MDSKYYSKNLSGERLRRVYEIAQPRIQQYFDAEINHVISRIDDYTSLLELGCGYGRVLKQLAGHIENAVGIDISPDNISYAKKYLAGESNCYVYEMDALSLDFDDNEFDMVICVQNGISSFRVDPAELIMESLRVAQPGGLVLFSSYSEKIWPERLRWFEMQSDEDLLGEIDREKTGDGVIVCKDGFRATTTSSQEFRQFCDQLMVEHRIIEVDESSLFCETIVP